VRIADRSVTVVAVHPSAPGPLLSGRWRAEQRRLAERASLIRDGAVLLGDFNATSDHPEVRRLQREGFAEARDQAGGGLQFTFPVARGPFPVAGLDRSMVRDVPWVATRATALNVSGGDHRAFVVEYAIGTS
jgi:endonuclease/exonuclease/phosphatase (EEP) superfamily protein YafD